MKVGNGCATVTGYEPPIATGHTAGKAGVRFKPGVRITACLRSSGIPHGCEGFRFSDKEKDETWPGTGVYRNC